MMQKLFIYNTLSREKEEFKAINPPHAGLYVCGPTVYGDAHLGHARPAVNFDLLFRFLKHLGYRVRYVRNITDVGHLENDADAGEDKIAKKARLDQVEPMEVVQHYLNQYHHHMRQLNVLSPSIEPHASGHIIEQQQLVRKILERGFAYESNGSVYFDVERYNQTHNYGILSGRKTDELLANTRELEGQQEKRSPLDFAIWKKADERHIMRWPSEWSEGFPGWHLECSAMSGRYLGEVFDIHGGGMDLLFPHHECEIAQTVAANGKPGVRYWMHNNMVTINGQKMGRSLGNFITLEEIFSGNHKLLEQAYSPMTIRFFILQAHYRGTIDFSNEALKAAEKGLNRLFEAMNTLEKLEPSGEKGIEVGNIINAAWEAMADDLNSPVALAQLFDAVRLINLVRDGKENMDQTQLEILKNFFGYFIKEILGLIPAEIQSDEMLSSGLIETLLELRRDAKLSGNYAQADRIRDRLTALGVVIKDGKEGTSWKLS